MSAAERDPQPGPVAAVALVGSLYAVCSGIFIGVGADTENWWTFAFGMHMAVVGLASVAISLVLLVDLVKNPSTSTR